TTATYQYDAHNRRSAKTVNGNTTYFIYDGDEVIAEYNGSNALQAEYVMGDNIDEILTMERAGQTYYYHTDGLGSITQITNSAGSIIEQYTYDSYGQPSVTSSAIGNPYMFTGRRFDEESGIYYYRNRQYDPAIGRFLQRDPLGYVDGMNLFSMVGNNPVNKIDPYGLFEIVGITDGQGNSVFDTRPYFPPLPSGPSRLEQFLQSTWEARQRVHQDVRKMGKNFPTDSGFGYEYLAAFEMMSLGGGFTTAGYVVGSSGTLSGIIAGSGWMLIGGEIVWLGVDFFIGLSERNQGTCGTE
ncbi:hypothetical protein MNBD_UNCLBAC01-1000, partial [hydrothermal vent metagenome]